VIGPVAGFGLRAAAPSLRVGGPIFLKSDDPVQLASEHKRLSYRAAYCPAVKTGETDRIRAIERAFGEADITLAEVGAWVNMMDADEEKRRQNLSYVIDRMALADAVGARTCVNISGSMNPKQWDGPDARNYSKEFFDATVENARKVIDSVKPKRSKFSIEMMPWTIPDSPDDYLRLLRAVDRPAFGVHVDVCNIVSSPEKYFRNGQIIDEVFRKLGKWVTSCHAKDLWGYRVHLAETIPGRGGIDYASYLRSIARYAPEAPLMLEHLSKPEEYDEGKRYLFEIARKVGVSLL
jgi:sugar phosphate isomerase/epimerase